MILILFFPFKITFFLLYSIYNTHTFPFLYSISQSNGQLSNSNVIQRSFSLSRYLIPSRRILLSVTWYAGRFNRNDVRYDRSHNFCEKTTSFYQRYKSCIIQRYKLVTCLLHILFASYYLRHIFLSQFFFSVKICAPNEDSVFIVNERLYPSDNSTRRIYLHAS